MAINVRMPGSPFSGIENAMQRAMQNRQVGVQERQDKRAQELQPLQTKLTDVQIQNILSQIKGRDFDQRTKEQLISLLPGMNAPVDPTIQDLSMYRNASNLDEMVDMPPNQRAGFGDQNVAANPNVQFNPSPQNIDLLAGLTKQAVGFNPYEGQQALQRHAQKKQFDQDFEDRQPKERLTDPVRTDIQRSITSLTPVIADIRRLANMSPRNFPGTTGAKEFDNSKLIIAEGLQKTSLPGTQATLNELLNAFNVGAIESPAAFQKRLSNFADKLEDRVKFGESQLASNRVNPNQGKKEASQNKPQNNQGFTKVLAPNGEVKQIPTNLVDKALMAGGKLVE